MRSIAAPGKRWYTNRSHCPFVELADFETLQVYSIDFHIVQFLRVFIYCFDASW